MLMMIKLKKKNTRKNLPKNMITYFNPNKETIPLKSKHKILFKKEIPHHELSTHQNLNSNNLSIE